ncbi:MAG TPA: RDD family protein [Roseiarcus sp.]|nr:RDD family protein [Roseiarcus sp.]
MSLIDAHIVSGPTLRAESFDGVRRRRAIALCLDLVLVSILAAVIWCALAILTFGLSIVLLPPIFPLVAFFYNGLTISGWRMATPGMRAMDLEMRMQDTGGRVPFINAAAQALFFYLSWMLPAVFLVTLVDREKRFLHDILAQVVVIRRL